MKSGRMLSFWSAVLAAALVALLSPFAHACPSDPRLASSSADDSYLDDLVDLVAAGAASFAGIAAIAPPPRRSPRLSAEAGSRYTSVPGRASPTRAPPLRLARSL